MGRYVLGEGFTYKFAFAEQSSSFGIVLERIAGDSTFYVNRYLGFDGEIVKIDIENPDDLIKAIKKYVGKIPDEWKENYIKVEDVQRELDRTEDYWNRFMMYEFLKFIRDEKDSFHNVVLEFFVDY